MFTYISGLALIYSYFSSITYNLLLQVELALSVNRCGNCRSRVNATWWRNSLQVHDAETREFAVCTNMGIFVQMKNCFTSCISDLTTFFSAIP